MYTIMIIEDNLKIRNELSDFLQKNGYQTVLVDDFEKSVELALQQDPHLILLDLNLPTIDGHYICRQIRQSSTVPIIIVTSRDSDIDELMSMNLGADDFITKPYNLQILLARVTSVIKRTYQPMQSSTILKCNQVTLDVSKSMLYYQDDSVELTKNELRIIHCLFINKGAIVSRDALMQHMWDNDLFVDDNTLTVNINRLRNKLKEIHLADFILTKRGLGYTVNENI